MLRFPALLLYIVLWWAPYGWACLCTNCMHAGCMFRLHVCRLCADNRTLIPLRTSEMRLLIRCGQWIYIYNLRNYLSTADTRNKYTLQQLHLPPTAESKLHLYLTESRTLFTTHHGQQKLISNQISELNLLTQTELFNEQLNTFDMDKDQKRTQNAHRLHS
jgi:hypothetical protein